MRVIRLWELARDLDVPVETLRTLLEERGVDVPNALAVVPRWAAVELTEQRRSGSLLTAPASAGRRGRRGATSPAAKEPAATPPAAAEGKGTDRRLVRRVAREARPFLGSISLLVLLELLLTPLALLTPVPLAIAVDSVIGNAPVPSWLDPVLPDGGGGLLAALAVMVVVLALATQVVTATTWVLRARTGEKLTLRFRARMFAHAQRLSLAFHDREGSSNSVYRIQYDAPSIQHITVDGSIPLVTAAVTVVAMLVVTASINTGLAVVAILVTPPLYILGRAYKHKTRVWYRDLSDVQQSAFGVVQEVFTGLRVVKAFGREDSEQQRFVDHANKTVRAQTRIALAESSFGLAAQLVIAAGTGMVLFVGTRAVEAGTLSLGDMLLVMTYLALLYAPLSTISRQLANLQGAFASAERAFVLLDHQQDVPEAPDAIALGRAVGRLEVRNVSFAYDEGEPVLDAVQLELPAGTRLGIAGRTGAGKSTLLNLITRFYDPTEGEILLDGIDLRSYRLADLRNQFGIVLQDPVLFSTTISENIAYGRPEATDADVVAAAQAANAHEFIVSLPSGYRTVVGERGMRLSGGERQRIALARAFLKDAPILILDEPTSSVDPRTEAAIMEAMDRLMEGRTVIMIAHRLQTLDRCDRILELEHGRLVSEGSVLRGAPAPAPPPTARPTKFSHLRSRRPS